MTTPKPKPAQRRRRTIPPRARETFLEALGAGWSVRHAATLTTHAFQRWYELRAADERFAESWAQAVEQGTQVLEDEARRRAVDGWEEPVYQQGELAGTVRKYSDQLLTLLLRGRRPTMYRESAPATSPVTIVLREYRLGDALETDGKPAIIEGQARELPPGKPAS